MMKSLFAAAAASALILPTFAMPAHAARGGMGGAVGKDPRVCLLTFSSAAHFGADAAVVKAQYLPLRIAMKHEAKDTSTMGIGYYGYGDLSAQHEAHIDFYYPDGSSSPTIGVTETSDTKTMCQAFMDYAEGQDGEGDND
jgi:hypothetical protein